MIKEGLFSVHIFIIYVYFLLQFYRLIPYTFTVTSHLIVTFALRSYIYCSHNNRLCKNGLGYLRIFYPSGIPIFLAPLIVPIEIISYLSKPISLSVRLCANMLAGHSILKIFAGFIVMLGFRICTISFLVVLYALETLLQHSRLYFYNFNMYIS